MHCDTDSVGWIVGEDYFGHLPEFAIEKNDDVLESEILFFFK